jgi:hypothetical protein
LLFIFFEANSPRPDGNVELDAGEQLSGAAKKAFSSFLLPNHVLFPQVNSETQADEALEETKDVRF